MNKAAAGESFPPVRLFPVILQIMTILFGLAPHAVVGAEEDVGEVPPEKTELPLALEKCLRQALERNLSLSAQALNIGIAEQGVISAQAPFDSQLGLDLLYEEAESREQATDSDRRRADVSWSKRIRTGQEFRVTHSASRFHRSADIPVSPFYDLEWTLSAMQPLARGAGRTVNMAPVWIAENQRKQAILLTEEAIMDLLYAVETAYLDLVYGMRYLDVQRSALNLAKELLAKNESFVAVGKFPVRSIEVLEAKASIAAREEGIIIALNGIGKAEDAIRRLLNLQVQFEEGRPRLIPADEPLIDLEVSKTDESLAVAIAHRPRVQALQFDVDSARLELTAARNSRLPNVDLRADIGFTGSNGDYGSSFDVLAEGRDYLWQVGLSVSYPWGNRAARSRYAQAKLIHDKARILLRDFLEELRLDVINAHRDIDTDIKRMASTKAAVEQAELQLQMENERFDQGMSNSFRILEFQDDLIEARIRHLAAIVDFNRSYYNLLRVEGRGISNERFDLTDIVEKILRQIGPFMHRVSPGTHSRE